MGDFCVQPDVVLAALDFIDSFDSDRDPQARPPATMDTYARRKTQNRSLTSGQRTRNEIERLRQAVAELEARVTALRHSASRRRISAVMHSLRTGSRNLRDTVSWEQAQRVRAQTDNMQLHEQVTKHAHLITKLERLVDHNQRSQATSRLGQQLVAKEAEVTRSRRDLGQNSHARVTVVRTVPRVEQLSVREVNFL